MALAGYTMTSNLYSILLGAGTFAGTSVDGLIQAFQAKGAASILVAKQQLAAACNRMHSQLVMDNPAVNQETTDLTLVSGTLDYNIPATLLRAEILRIQYIEGASAEARGFEIEYCSPNDFAMLYGASQDPNQAASFFPRNFTLLPALTQIRFSSFQAAGTYRVTYRKRPDLWDLDDVLDAASTVYAAIPDEFIDVLQMQIAMAACLRNGNGPRIAELRLELYSRPSQTKRSRYDELLRTLANVAATKDRMYWSDNLPHTGNQPLRMGGANGSGGNGSVFGGFW